MREAEQEPQEGGPVASKSPPWSIPRGFRGPAYPPASGHRHTWAWAGQETGACGSRHLPFTCEVSCLHLINPCLDFFLFKATLRDPTATPRPWLGGRPACQQVTVRAQQALSSECPTLVPHPPAAISPWVPQSPPPAHPQTDMQLLKDSPTPSEALGNLRTRTFHSRGKGKVYQ